VTLQGSMNSSSFIKRNTENIGLITGARVGTANCIGLKQFTLEGTPWRLQYNGFTGTLPNIGTIRVRLINAVIRITEATGCQYKTLETDALRLILRGEASHVIVDFQLANAKLEEGKDHVHITVLGPGIADKLEAKAEKFGPPYFLDNLQNGTYTVKCELMSGSGADMKLIPGAWNSTTRTIKIDHDAQPDATPPAPTASAASSAAPAKK